MAEPNPRAVSGDNTDAIDYAKIEVDRLFDEYPHLLKTAAELEAEFEKVPEEIDGPETKDTVVDLIKRIRDAGRRIESIREIEKQPYFRRGQGVDQFFNRMIDRLAKREKRNNDGAADVLNRRLTDYDVRVLAAENERRRLAAEEADRVASAARAEEARLGAEAEEARLRAERARTPETTAAKTEVAEQIEGRASAAVVEAAVASARAEDAYVQTLARPSDVMRTRTGAGTLATMQQETYAEIENVSQLDAVRLWAHLSFADKEKALRAWAKATDYREAMPGAKVGRRPKSQVR